MSYLREIMQETPVIPVLAFRDVEEAVEICGLLHETGLRVLEITLRHPSALDCIRAVKDALPAEACIGAGTVTSADLVGKAIDAGAVFGVSPGLTAALSEEVRSRNWPFLPGVATLSEAMRVRELGFTELKFFPASVAGGPAFLKAVHSVLPDLAFCPTGGINADNVRDYSELPNVLTVGGSWITPRGGDGKIDLALVRQRAGAVFNT